jgi:flagella basal body P-ring formation protein FlgA
MIRSLTVVFAALIALGAPAAAQVTAPLSQERPKLKAEVTVTGDLVRIGDLVEHAGVIAAVPIFRAPDLGATGSVSAASVVEAVHAHALVGLDTGGVQEVAVTRASRIFSPNDFEDCVAQALSSRFSLGAAGEIAISFDGDLRPLHVEPNAEGELHIARINYDAHNGRFQATVEVPTGASQKAPLRLTGRASATVELVTLARAVERGVVLKDADVVVERRPRAQLGKDVITERTQAIGLAARTNLEPGRPLRTAQLMKPELVRRNEHVTLIYEVPGILLTVRGKAMESGAEGDVVAVLNEQSKRTIQGVVAGPGHVVISSAPARFAVNTAQSENGKAP